jgi:hypothetical protein
VQKKPHHLFLGPSPTPSSQPPILNLTILITWKKMS